MNDRWSEVEALFMRAADLPAVERERFLDEACNGDDSLRAEVLSLLDCDTPDVPLLTQPVLLPPGDHKPGGDVAGQRMGAYKLVSLLGRGGMGAVYLATRADDQYNKQVAIKLLQRGMDTELMLDRFRQERQILANLEHPYIARLVDGGTTEDGLPYIVMEYIDGVPVTKYCAALDLERRLQLFRLICEAVHYAHQNLVVHRDLKPGNILVTKEGIPKLLDFGIAKLVSTDLGVTQRELRMMTPDYASPEQIMGQPIGMAADIYALGALLYELLTGKRAHHFDTESPGEIERVICNVDPEKPSSVVRRATGHVLSARRIAGDLDRIVLMAMRKEAPRRYSSAAELSEDIRRHLDGLPVIAQPDRLTYRAGKFIRRNKLAVVGAVLLLASLLGGIVTTTIQARRAEQRFQLVRGLANSMLYDLHDQMALLPGSTELRASTVRTVATYLDSLGREASQDPQLELEIATAYHRVARIEGNPYRSNLGHSAPALEHYLKAITIFERLVNRKETRDAATAGAIATNIDASSLESVLGHPASSTALFQKAWAMASVALERGSPVIPYDVQEQLFFQLGELEYQKGSAESEVMRRRQLVDVCTKWLAESKSPQAASRLRSAYADLGSALSRAGDLEGARQSLMVALKVTEELTARSDVRDEERNSVGVHNSLGDLLAATDDLNLGDRKGAWPHYQSAMASATRMASSDQKNLNGRRNLAACFRRYGMYWMDEKPADALEYYGQSLKLSDDLNAGDVPNMEYRYAVSRAEMGVGEALHHLKRDAEALPHLRRAVELQRLMEAASPGRIWNLRVLSRTYFILGGSLAAAGDSDAALDALRQGLAAADRMLQRAPTSMMHQVDRGDVLEATGMYWLKRAAKPGTDPSQTKQMRADARSSFQQSEAIWQDWIKRRVGSPYAQRRLEQVQRMMVSVGR